MRRADGLFHLPRASEAEEDMLDLAAGATRLSRLSCQIRVGDAGDELTVRIPGESRDMQGV
jgi:ferredoxin